MHLVTIYNLDGTTEEYRCVDSAITGIGYALYLEDGTKFIVSPSSVNKLRIKEEKDNAK